MKELTHRAPSVSVTPWGDPWGRYFDRGTAELKALFLFPRKGGETESFVSLVEHCREHATMEGISMASEMEFELTEEKENGRPVYKNQYGTKYGACEEDLYDYLRVQVLGRISDFFGMAEEGDEETANMGHIFRLLVSDAEKKLERVFNLVEASIGDMTIHSLSGGYPWHDDALPLAVFLETKEAKAEERRKAQQEEAERRNPIKTAESFRQGVSTLLGDLQRDGFDALSIAKDILSGKPKPIEEYKKQVGKSKAPVLPLAGKAGKGNGKGVQHA